MPTLHVTRSYRTADLARPYQIVLDGDAIGKIRTHSSTELSIASGTHTLQICVPRLLMFPEMASPPLTFEAEDGGRVVFVCHPPRFAEGSWLTYVACLLGRREWWVELEGAR